ncbi:MAG: TRAP transporter large permease subunit, partial [Acidobacteria bacterium]|nr:TRAP transporter large permease subunit [Acidobacteriota bacterium]
MREPDRTRCGPARHPHHRRGRPAARRGGHHDRGLRPVRPRQLRPSLRRGDGQRVHTAYAVLLRAGRVGGHLRTAARVPTAAGARRVERRRPQRTGRVMGGTEIALSGFAALLVLLLIRVPVGLAMLIVGLAGIAAIRPGAVVPVVAGEMFAVSSRYPLTILPLFMLMGHLAVVSGMSHDLYRAAHGWLSRVRGSLASASIVACAGFSALSGSSLAAALTMGRVSLPEMRRFRYDDSLATGAIAAGGTLGILIPPSA